jgi:hypothetical protein
VDTAVLGSFIEFMVIDSQGGETDAECAPKGVGSVESILFVSGVGNLELVRV